MKKNLGALNCLYPLPTILVGAMVNEKPNYITMAHVGVMAHVCISLGMNKVHYTNSGIKQTGTFSVNIPSEEMVVETDYCGLVSGKKVDKNSLFENFYGELKTAPMIKKCLLNMECKLVKTVDFPNHDVFIGEVVATYADEEILVDGAVDISRLKPVLFDRASKKYWKLGEPFADCWNIGNQLKKK